MKKVFLVAALLLVGAGCEKQPDMWSGIYYYDKSVGTNYSLGPRSATLEECQAWLVTSAETSNPDGTRADQGFCCKNIDYTKSSDGSFTCEETVE